MTTIVKEPTTAKVRTTDTRMSPFPKIADCGFLSNCHTGGACRLGRLGGLALCAEVRLAQRLWQFA